MMWRDSGWSAGEWISMAFVMVLFWGLVLFAAVAYLRSGHSRPESSPPTDLRDSERTLAERFARGEIDVEEFNQRRDALRSKRP